MELRNLRYFVTVAEEGNITRAAEKLAMTQSPLSYQMQMLEDELGAKLLVRSKRGVTLTPEGAMLLRRARELIEMEEKACREIREMRSGISGQLSVGLVEGRAPFLAANWIAGFHEEFPNVKFNLWNGSTDDTLERISKGLADVAVVAAPYNAEAYDGITVGREPWVAIIPSDHPLAQEEGDEIELIQLAQEKLIVPARKSRMEAIRQWFGEIGAQPDFLCETSNYLDALALTEKGVGISIFPQTTKATYHNAKTKIIAKPALHVEYVLVWKSNHTPTPLAEEFINYVRDCLQSEA